MNANANKTIDNINEKTLSSGRMLQLLNDNTLSLLPVKTAKEAYPEYRRLLRNFKSAQE
jgi:hypothetical protein